jgi:hypothetical protein
MAPEGPERTAGGEQCEPPDESTTKGCALEGRQKPFSGSDARGPRMSEYLRALTYIASNSKPGSRRAGYLEPIIDPAADHGLPMAYGVELTGWAMTRTLYRLSTAGSP